ncbi:hypothetical protein PhCBS80983_g02239 [Powellomyces hirtus]|uniref:SLC41A/MgtE integral membrane domain-containing protein n=1 Tax=Powellomyces hirtus TaxID=109895 RepID=A0A507E9U3_9FUNG|nr:hypothetical protein PhCBS80983_g02239 [Powellomyces hirtus]
MSPKRGNISGRSNGKTYVPLASVSGDHISAAHGADRDHHDPLLSDTFSDANSISPPSTLRRPSNLSISVPRPHHLHHHGHHPTQDEDDDEHQVVVSLLATKQPSSLGSAADHAGLAQSSHSPSFLKPTTIPEQDFLSLILHQSNLDDAQELCRARLDYLYENDDARKMQRTPFYKIALYRFPAILLTLCLELIVAAIIDRYSSIRTSYPLLSAFFPVLSSISGNVGLQASTTTLRALATGHASHSNTQDVIRLIIKEFLSALVIASVASVALTLIANAWSGGNLAFGLVTGGAIFVASSLGGIIGSTGPLLFKKLGIDPALTAGPFETAAQDMIGVAVYLSLATSVLGTR